MTANEASIIFLIPGFPEDEADTTCLPAVQNYVAAFAEAHPEWETHVIAFQYPYTRRTYRWKNATVHALGGANRRGWPRLRTWRRAAQAVWRLHRQSDIRILHSFWLTECTWVAQWLGIGLRLRHVASIGGQDAKAGNPYLKRLRLDRLTLTAGSAFAAETFAEHAGRRVDSVIPLGLDTGHLRRIAPPRERDIDVLGVGSLVPVKNYAAFLDVIAHLVPTFPHLRACIVGEGPLHDALQQMIVEKKLEAHVVLAGALPRDEVFRCMLRSTVFLHPSQYESQGYVFLEARFAGLPVVCFDVGHPGDDAFVFRCTTLPAMTDTVAALLAGPSTFPSACVLSVEDTVRAFEPLYGLSPQQTPDEVDHR